MGVLSIGLGKWSGIDPLKTMPRPQEVGKMIEGVVDGFLVGTAIFMFAVWLYRTQSTWVRVAAMMLVYLTRHLYRGASASHIFAVCLSAGVGEGLLFRGWLQPWLATQFSFMGNAAIWVAIFCAAMIWALGFAMSIGNYIMSVFIGVLLGSSFHLTGSIIVPIVAQTLLFFILSVWSLYLAVRKEKTT